MSAERNSEKIGPDVRYERTDISVRPILVFAAAMVAAAVVVLVVVALLFPFLGGRAPASLPEEYPTDASEQNELPLEPRLQTNPREDLERLRAREDAVLGSYGWIDRNAGVVRLPITEAMRLTVERGLPARPAPGSEQPDSGNSGATKGKTP